MNFKLLLLLLSILLIGAASSQAVEAQLFGGPFFEKLGESLSNELSWPPWGEAKGETTITVGNLIFVYMLLFALLYIVSHFVPIFNKTPHKNAVVFFIFAFAGIAVANTTFVADIVGLIGLSIGVLSIALLLLLILATIFFAKWFGGSLGGPIGKIPGVGRVGEALHGKAEQTGEAVARKIEGEKGKEEREEQQEQALLSNLRRLESADFREISDARAYIEEAVRILETQQRELGRNPALRGKLSAALDKVSADLTSARTHEYQLQSITNALTQEIRQEYETLSDDLKIQAQSLGKLNAANNRNIINYTNKERDRTVNDFKRSGTMLTFERDLKTKIDGAIAAFSGGITQINTGNLPLAETAFKEARTYLRQAEADAKNLTPLTSALLTDARTKISINSLTQHLARAGVP